MCQHHETLVRQSRHRYERLLFAIAAIRQNRHGGLFWAKKPKP